MKLIALNTAFYGGINYGFGAALYDTGIDAKERVKFRK